jgi:uncharacterized membrane protein
MDPAATGQAAGVVVLTGLLAGIGSWLGGSSDFSLTVNDETYDLGDVSAIWAVLGTAAAVILALLFWAVISAVYRFVATRFLDSPEQAITWDEVARPMGFATVPALATVFSAIPVIGWLVSLVISIWGFAAEIVALSQTFRVSKWRAFGIIVVSAILLLVVIFIPLCCVLGLLAS